MNAVQQGTGPDHGMTRREAQRRGALVGSALWVVPVAQVVSVTPAAADTASAPTPGGGARPVTVPAGKPFDVRANHQGAPPAPVRAHSVRRRRRRRVRRHRHHA